MPSRTYRDVPGAPLHQIAVGENPVFGPAWRRTGISRLPLRFRAIIHLIRSNRCGGILISKRHVSILYLSRRRYRTRNPPNLVPKHCGLVGILFGLDTQVLYGCERKNRASETSGVELQRSSLPLHLAAQRFERASRVASGPTEDSETKPSSHRTALADNRRVSYRLFIDFPLLRLICM